jgi:hypothetical protein
MVKIPTIAQREQYSYGPYTVPYGPYGPFSKNITKKAAI